MMRALVIEPSGDLWGSERALLDMLDNVRGMDLAVCCPPETPLQRELTKRHIRAIPYYVYGLHKKRKWHRLRAAFGVLRSCLQFRPDVIYLNQSGSYKIVLPAAWLLRLPIVAHVRIFEDAAYLARQNPDESRLRGLIAISAAIESEIRRFPSLDVVPVHRIYDAYVPTPNEVHSNAATTVKRIACIGRIVPVKGQDVLVKALGALVRPGFNIECLIVGEGDKDFLRRLTALAIGARILHSVQLTGFVADVVPLLRTCVVLVCPSHREPLGRVIFEAWDAGIVPIAYAGSGGAAEIIAASQGGLLYEAQTPDALAKVLQEALELERERSERLVRNGRAWMARNCSPGPYAESITRILSDACAK